MPSEEFCWFLRSRQSLQPAASRHCRIQQRVVDAEEYMHTLYPLHIIPLFCVIMLRTKKDLCAGRCLGEDVRQVEMHFFPCSNGKKKVCEK